MNRRDFSKKAAIFFAAIPFTTSLTSFDSFNKRLKPIKKNYQFEDFKNNKGINVISNPIFIITKDEKTEVLAFITNFNLKTGSIKKTITGHKQMKMSIENWEGECFSKLLNKMIGFKVTKTYTDDSNLTSTNLNKDFPSTMSLKIKYNLMLDVEFIREVLIGRVYSTLVDELHLMRNHKMLVEGGEITMKNFKFNFCAA